MKETLFTELKERWYWNDSIRNKKKNNLCKEDGTMLKDIVALFNTVDDGILDSVKKLIIGVSDNGQLCTENNSEVEEFRDLDKLRKKIIQKIDDKFTKISHQEINQSFDLDPYLEIDHQDDGCIVFTIYGAPFLLKSNQEIGTDSSPIRAGDILTRKLDNNGPSNSLLDHDEINNIKELLKNRWNAGYYLHHYKSSIDKIVDFYKKTRLPKANDGISSESIPRGCEFCFLEDKDMGINIAFLYISKMANQENSIQHFSNNIDWKNADQRILFYDEKNKSGGLTNIQGIKKRFEQMNIGEIKTTTIDQWITNTCQEILEGVDSSEYFMSYEERKTFISPSIEGQDTEAFSVLEKWLDYPNGMPIMLINGAGGIGKTTLIKYFLAKKSTKKALLLNAVEIIPELQKKERITFSDFYDCVADQYNNNFAWKDSLNLAVSAGKIIIVIDGLDEIISALKDKFDIEDFFNSIQENYTSLFRTRIIVSCRDTQWKPTNSLTMMHTITLKEFNEEQVKKYFGTLEPKQQNKALAMAKKICVNNKFIPYILSMIKDGKIDENDTESIQEMQIACLLPEEINDRIIYKVCEREKNKQSMALTIDEQITIFTEIATKYNGRLTDTHFDDLGKKYKKAKISEALKKHPILALEKEDIFVFRYEFWNNWFKMLSICKKVIFLNKKNHAKFDEEIQRDFCKVDQNEIIKRLKKCEDYYELKYKFMDWVSSDFNINDQDQRYFNSDFFVLLLLLQTQDINQRTELLKEIYLSNGKIQKVCLINLSKYSNERKITFHFEQTVFYDCYFSNYEDFKSCTFDSGTLFEKSHFHQNILFDNQDITNTTFDLTSCIMDDKLKDRLEIKKENGKTHQDKKAILQIAKFFYSGGRFVYKTEQESQKKLRNHYEIFEKLKKIGVIKPAKISTKQKNNNISFSVSDEYYALAKAIEENQSHPILFEIIKKIENEKNHSPSLV